MDLLSGLLLTGVVLFILGFIVKEALGEHIASLLGGNSGESAGPVTNALIGAVGRVLHGGDEDNSYMKVRIGIERWNARLVSADDGQLPVGAEVRVTAVNGLVLDVEAITANDALQIEEQQ